MTLSQAQDSLRPRSATAAGTESPWGVAGARRNTAIANLVPSFKALTEQLHDVLLQGGLTVEEYEHLHSLQIWVGRLMAEFEVPKGQAPRSSKK